MKLADGRDVELLERGTRIRSVEHPGITGRIRCIEMCRPGVPSALPYNVEWDNHRAARDVMGILCMYQDVGTVAKID